MMRWRPFTWFLLSVFCFVAAAFFWRLGDEWAAKKAASRPSSQTTNESVPFKPATNPAAQAMPFHLLTQAGNQNVSYIPNNAYLVLASAGVARRLAADARTQTVLPYEPVYKIQPPSLLKLAVEQQSLAENTPLNLLLFPGAREKTILQLQDLQV